jgi:hypothetical protein
MPTHLSTAVILYNISGSFIIYNTEIDTGVSLLAILKMWRCEFWKKEAKRGKLLATDRKYLPENKF